METSRVTHTVAGWTRVSPFPLEPPPLPREHGSWFMLLVPCAAGLVAAGGVNLPGLLFALVATAFFLARQPLLLLIRKAQQPRPSWRFWLGTWAAVSGFGLAVLLLVYRRLPLLPISLVGLALLVYEVWRWRRSPRPDLGTELLAAVGMASSAPGAYVAVRGLFDQGAAVVWALSALYFLAAVFYINLMLAWLKRNPQSQSDRWHLGLPTVRAQVAALAAGLVLTLAGWAPLLAPLAFLPALAKTLWQVPFGGRETNFKRLGLIEAAHSLAFLALLLIAYR